ncbi:hypothetical protein MMC13_002029 [Lambiella insularis]|nr:hypothetical protein [Lambiella insularis]
MRILLLSSALLFMRFGIAALDEIICHNEYIQRYRYYTEHGLRPGFLSAYGRLEIAARLTRENADPQVIRLFATPQPLDMPMTMAECLNAASLIPEYPTVARHNPIDDHNPGDAARPNLQYTDAQRENILRYRLDAGFVSGNCLIQIIRRPGHNPGLSHVDASAMALAVYPKAREKALAVIHQCLSGARGRHRYRFGHVGTTSEVRSPSGERALFYYVVSVTLWPGGWTRYRSEHFYDQRGEIQGQVMADVVGPTAGGWGPRFPFLDAF